MVGQSGAFTIKLAVQCAPIAFGIEYKLDLQHQMNDAVKQFEVLGVYEENQEFYSVLLGKYEFGRHTDNEIVKFEQQFPGACITQLKTQTNNIIKQYFICYEEDCKKSFDIFHIQIHNNYGGTQFTSIYRFAIYQSIAQFELFNSLE